MTSMLRRLGGICLALVFVLSLAAPLLADRSEIATTPQVDETVLDAASRIIDDSGTSRLNPSAFDPAKGGPGIDTPGHHPDSPAAPSLQLRSPEPIDPPPIRELNLVLDWYLSPQHAALIVARERGDFNRLGLKVNIATPADPSVPVKLVAASRADLALGRQTQLHRQVARGMPLIRVATLIGTPLNSLVVRADTQLDTLRDLRGKTIGYGIQEDVSPLLSVMLKHHGLELDDVTLKGVDFAVAPALASQQVDAVIGAMRHVVPYQLREEGLRSHSFLVEEHGVPRYDELIVIANRDHLNVKRDDIRRFITALEDATHWIINYPDAAWELLAQSEPTLDSAANRQTWPETLRRLSLRPATVDARRYLEFQTFLVEQGLIRERHPIERLAVDVSEP